MNPPEANLTPASSHEPGEGTSRAGGPKGEGRHTQARRKQGRSRSKAGLLEIGKLVHVTWDDASSADEGWALPKQLQNAPQHCETVGWVVARNRRFVRIAMTKGVHSLDGKDEWQYATTYALPLGWIKTVQVIE